MQVWDKARQEVVWAQRREGGVGVKEGDVGGTKEGDVGSVKEGEVGG